MISFSVLSAKRLWATLGVACLALTGSSPTGASAAETPTPDNHASSAASTSSPEAMREMPGVLGQGLLTAGVAATPQPDIMATDTEMSDVDVAADSEPAFNDNSERVGNSEEDSTSATTGTTDSDVVGDTAFDAGDVRGAVDSADADSDVDVADSVDSEFDGDDGLLGGDGGPVSLGVRGAGDFNVAGACAYSYATNELTVSGSGCVVTSSVPTGTDRLTIDTAGGDVTLTLVDVTIDHSVSGVDVAPIRVSGPGTATLLLDGDNTVTVQNFGMRAGVEVDATAKLIIDSATNPGTTDGTLTAESYWGAGVGGGDGAGGSDITISGGTVTASSTFGAGIGGGWNGNGSGITISGGTVTASSDSGAGIGGGQYGSGSDIMISSGSVTASSTYGAGVGGGEFGSGSNNFVSGLSWRSPTVLKASTAAGGAAVQGLSVADAFAYRTSATGVFTVAGGGTAVLGGGFFEARVPVVPIDWDPGAAAWASGLPVLADLYCGAENTTAPGMLDFTSIPSGTALSGWSVEYGTSRVFVPTGQNMCATVPDDYAGRVKATAVWSELVVTSSDDIGVSYAANGEWTLEADGTREFTVTMAPGITNAPTDHLTIDTTSGDITITLQDTTIDHTNNSVDVAPIRIKGTGTATLLLEGDNTAKAYSYGNRAGVEVDATATLTIDSATNSGSTQGTLTASGYVGSGIGGGSDADGTDITVMGGSVDAFSEYGAGVGGGFNADGTDIAITGGSVDAFSEYGAGVGGGRGGSGLNNHVSGASWRSPTVLKASSLYGIVATQGLSVDGSYAYRTTDTGVFTVASSGTAVPGGTSFEAQVPVAALSWGAGVGSWTGGLAPVLPTYCDADGPVAAPSDSVVTAPVGKRLAGWSVSADGTPVGVVASGNDVCGSVPDAGRAVVVSAVFEFVPELEITDTASGNPVVGAFDPVSGTWRLSGGGSYQVQMVSGLTMTSTNHLVADTSGGDMTITLADVTIDHGTNSSSVVAPIRISGNGSATLLLEGDNTAKAQYAGIRAGVEVDTNAKLTIDSATTPGSSEGTLTTRGGQGAGIGGGVLDSGSDLEISGGTVTASSSGGAGIGGGAGGDGSDITITGGTVTASSDSGAGIGGGSRAGGSDITISGGTVEAASSEGAGVGGGSFGGDGSNIRISDGSVEASSTWGAGVGGGRVADGSDITIMGGSVTASSTGGAGIGGGENGSGSNNHVSGASWRSLTVLKASSASGAATQGVSVDSSYVYRTSDAGAFMVASGGPVTLGGRFFEAQVPVAAVSWDVGDGSWTGGVAPVLPTYCDASGPVAAPAASAVVAPVGKSLAGWSVTVDGTPVGVVPAGGDVCASVSDAGRVVAVSAVFEFVPELEITNTVSGNPAGTFDGDSGRWMLDAGGSYLVKMAPGVSTTSTNHLLVDTNGGDVTITLADVTIDHSAGSDVAPIRISGPGTATLLLEGDNTVTAQYGGDRAGVEVEDTAVLVVDSVGVGGSRGGVLTVVAHAGAGIGGGSGSPTGGIVIGGGTLFATSVSGAGIGGGAGAPGSHMRIEGGYVTASSDTGAGIGGGAGSTGSSDNLIVGDSTRVASPVEVVATSDQGTAVEGGTAKVTTPTSDMIVAGVWDEPTPSVGVTGSSLNLGGGGYARVITPVELFPLTYDLGEGHWDGGTPPVGLLTRISQWDTAVISAVPVAPPDFVFTGWQASTTSRTIGVRSVISEVIGFLADVFAAPTDLTLSGVSGPLTLTATYQRVRPTITTDSLPGGTVGEAYTQTLAATGDAPIRWQVTVGSLPDGLTLDTDTGVISGTPTVAGDYAFTVEATDTNGSATKEYTLTVTGVPELPGTPPTITTDSLPGGTVGEDYTQGLTVTGDAPITWKVTTGSLPEGLALDADSGVISGIPTVAGEFAFTVEAANAVGSDSKQYVLTIVGVPVTPGMPPTIITDSLLGGTVGEAYNQALEATGDTPLTWKVNAGSLPDGHVLDADSGVISGIPTVAGEFAFTVEATNAVGSDSKQYVITVVEAGVPVVPGPESGGEKEQSDSEVAGGAVTDKELSTTGANTMPWILLSILIAASGSLLITTTRKKTQ